MLTSKRNLLWISVLLAVETCGAEQGSCFFSYLFNKTTKSQVFGPELTGVETPCLVWFKTEVPGYFRIDINNKIFASKREKKSCLSEYVIVSSEDSYTKLCHSNVTVPVEIKHFSGELTVLIKWVGELDPSTSYLGRVNFEEGLASPIDDEDDLTAKLAESISEKLRTFMIQKNQEHRLEDIKNFKYKSADDCALEQGVLCKHSRFCADLYASTTCNSSLYLCLPHSAACNGANDCLDGDLSDETGCYLPYVLISTGGVILSMTLLGSVACIIQHHKVMSGNDMVRFNNDLVRRKDKVKARKADLYSNKPGAKKGLTISSNVNLNGNKKLEKDSSKASLLSSSVDSNRVLTDPSGSKAAPAAITPTSKAAPVTSSLSPAASAAAAAPAPAAVKTTASAPAVVDQVVCSSSTASTDAPSAVSPAKTAMTSPPIATSPSQSPGPMKTIPSTFSTNSLSTYMSKPPIVEETNSFELQPPSHSNGKPESSPAKGSSDQSPVNSNGRQASDDEQSLNQKQMEERQRTLSRRDKRILADERDIRREIRQRKDSLTQDKQCYTERLEMNGEPSITQSQLERLEQVGITPIRRPIIRDDSQSSLLGEKQGRGNNEDGGRSGYGYRFDFRNSAEFEFTDDAYI